MLKFSTHRGMFVDITVVESVGGGPRATVGSLTTTANRTSTILGIVAAFIILCRRNGSAPTPKCESIIDIPS